MGIPANVKGGRASPEYIEGDLHIKIAVAAFAILLLLEFFVLIWGVSVMYKRVNSAQVLLHGLGVLGCIWMILDRWHYLQAYVLAVVFGLIPFLLEISAVFDACIKYKVVRLIQHDAQTESTRQKLHYEQYHKEKLNAAPSDNRPPSAAQANGKDPK